MAVTIELKGARQLLRKLEQLDQKTGMKAQKKALRAGAQPVLKSARKKVPVETGALKRNLAISVKGGARARQISAFVVGRNKKDPRTGRNPAHYLHLVHGGAAPHEIRGLLRLGSGGGPDVYTRLVQHPGFKGNEFLLDAFSQERRNALRRIMHVLRTEIYKV